MKLVSRSAAGIVTGLVILLFTGCGVQKQLTAVEKVPPLPVKKEALTKKESEFDKLIPKGTECDEGLFKVYKVKNNYYFEIPDSLEGREMLIVSRIAKSADNTAHGGENLQNMALRWERFDDEMLLRVVSYDNVANDSLPIYTSVKNSNYEPILMTFPIKAVNPDSTGVVIDVTDFFSSDIQAINLPRSLKSRFKISSFDRSRSFITSIKAFPMNVEARHIMTYRTSKGDGPDYVSFEISNSILLLPEKPMKRRFYDQRIGYFTTAQVDYGSDEHKAAKRTYIRRWRLEPGDMKAYLAGELVEPKKPIVFYIDPATPEKWRPFIKQGVEDWQVAFEAAGFKNAILAKDPPEKQEDPDWSPEDSRYSVIRYFASEIQNASGPNVQDPRSGEIIESDIGWHHNVMNLLRNWYFVQTAAANPEARRVKFNDEVMGKLIRFVATHEVGHALGLTHNMGASHAYPVDSLRSPSFLKKHGITPSIMDYARFNYVAQPEDGVETFIPKIGEYDIYAIKWGYSLLPQASPYEEKKRLHELIVQHAADPVFHYGRQMYDPIDPRSQMEDLGDDAVKASRYGIQNLKKLMPELISLTYEEGESFDQLEELYEEVLRQWRRYLGHVKTYIGGMYETFSTFDQKRDVYQITHREKQKEAMQFLHQEAFKTPSWMINEEILRRIEPVGAIKRIGEFQEDLLRSLLNRSRLSRLIESYAIQKDQAYSLVEMMSDLRSGIFSEIYEGESIDVYRRNLQRIYITRMGYLTEKAAGSAETDIQPVVRGELVRLKTDLQGALSVYSATLEKYHLADLINRIDVILEAKN